MNGTNADTHRRLADIAVELLADQQALLPDLLAGDDLVGLCLWISICPLRCLQNFFSFLVSLICSGRP
jgi:hypothetical protein